MRFSSTIIESFTEMIGLFYRSRRFPGGTVILLLCLICRIEVGWFRRSIDSERLRVSSCSSTFAVVVGVAAVVVGVGVAVVVEEPVVIIGVDDCATSGAGDRFLYKTEPCCEDFSEDWLCSGSLESWYVERYDLAD